MTKPPREAYFNANGKFKKGHPPLNQHQKLNPEPPPDPTDTNTDFDAAIIAAAATFGTPLSKQKTGMAGYCANLRDSRPVEYAALLKSALTRTQFAAQSAAAAIPITIEFATCPNNYFIPGEEARALWAARTGERPVLVVDNNSTSENSEVGDPDTDAITFSDPDDA